MYINSRVCVLHSERAHDLNFRLTFLNNVLWAAPPVPLWNGDPRTSDAAQDHNNRLKRKIWAAPSVPLKHRGPRTDDAAQNTKIGSSRTTRFPYLVFFFFPDGCLTILVPVYTSDTSGMYIPVSNSFRSSGLVTVHFV